VWVLANRGSLAQNATSPLDLTVLPITVVRLQSEVSNYQQAGDIADSVAGALRSLLAEAEQHLNAGATSEACGDLNDVLNLVGAEKGKGITDSAADALTRETKALRSDLGC
jgi:hypothetical protein